MKYTLNSRLHGGNRVNKINNFIDLILIDMYASRGKDGYQLDTSEISQYDIDSFIHLIMREDTSLTQTILSQMQDMIDARLEVKNDNYNAEYFNSFVNPINGEITRVLKRGVA